MIGVLQKRVFVRSMYCIRQRQTSSWTRVLSCIRLLQQVVQRTLILPVNNVRRRCDRPTMRSLPFMDMCKTVSSLCDAPQSRRDSRSGRRNRIVIYTESAPSSPDIASWHGHHALGGTKPIAVHKCLGPMTKNESSMAAPPARRSLSSHDDASKPFPRTAFTRF
jgi:hypothetical protein